MGPLLLLAAVLGAAPLQLTVSRSVGLEPAEAQALAQRLRSTLAQANIPDVELIPDVLAQACEESHACLRDLVRSSEGRLLLEMELAWVAGQLGANLSATEVSDDSVLAAHRFIVHGGERYHLSLDAELARFAELLRARLPPELLATASAKQEAPPAALEVTPPEVSTPHHPAFKKAAMGGAAASGVLAAVFASLGIQANDELQGSYVNDPSGGRTSSLDQQRAQGLAGAANARFTGALISSGLALGFAGVAVWLELQEAE